MRLLEYEALIKEQVKKDKHNPEIYENLQQMILIFLKRKKICKSARDYEDMSYLLAGDIYLAITQGEEFSYYLGYLEKVHRKYAQDYYEKNSSEILEFDESIDYDYLIYGNPSIYEYNCINNKIYLENIDLVINEVMENSCKYDPNTSAFINLKLSLILSLLQEDSTPISFHLSEEQEVYLKMILTNFHNKIIKECLNEDDNRRVYS